MPGYFSIPASAYPQYTVGMLTPRTAATTPTTLKATGKPGVRRLDGTMNPVATGGTGTGEFDINPQPQTGQGAYGAVPGPIAYPTTPYAEATRIYPGLANLTPMAGEEIRSQIAGEFSPQEEAALWDLANTYGVASGMPGSQLWSNKFFGNRIEEGMKRRQQGVENYNAMLAELSKMGVDPALAAEIAARNANMAAAPNPKDAAAELERKYLNAAMNPAGGTLNPSGISPGSYGSGFNPPGFSSPAGGTLTPKGAEYLRSLGTPMNTTGTGGYGRTWNNQGGYASTTEGNAPYTTPIYQDEYDWLWNQGTPVETPATPMYQDEYNWLWDQGTPQETYTEPTPMYEDEFDWLWNQGEEDPWAIYE